MIIKDGHLFLNSFLAALIFIGLTTLYLIATFFLAPYALYVLIVSLLVLAISIGLAWKRYLTGLYILGMVVPAVALAATSIIVWYTMDKPGPGITLAVVSALVAAIVAVYAVRLVTKKVWKQIQSIPGNTAVIVKTPSATVPIKGNANIILLMPEFAFEIARIPLYGMQSDLPLEKVKLKGTKQQVTVNVSIEYALNSEKEWFKAMGLPNRPSYFEKLKKETGLFMKDIIFWERVYEHLVKDEVEGCIPSIIYNYLSAHDDIQSQYNMLEQHAQSEIEKALSTWGLKVKSFTICNIKMNKSNHAEAEDKADVQATFIGRIRSETIQRSITAVGLGIQSLKEQGITLTPDEMEHIVHIAIREIAQTLRFGQNNFGDMSLDDLSKELVKYHNSNTA